MEESRRNYLETTMLFHLNARYVFALVGALTLATTALGDAGAWFRDKNGNSVGYWDDMGSWWTSDSYSANSSSLGKGCWARHMTPTVLMVTNGVSDTVKWFTPGTTANGWATLVIENGGTLTAYGSDGGGGLEAGEWANSKGLVDVRSGGTLEFRSLVLGYAAGSQGVLTNAGSAVSKANSSSPLVLGRVAGSSGLWVSDGGAIGWSGAAPGIVVGQNGTGEIVAMGGDGNRSTDDFWVSGDVRVGNGTEGTGRGRVVVEDRTDVWSSGALYLGGATGLSGHGELALRGGTYNCRSTRGYDYNEDTVWIGAAGSGATFSGSHGEIRGWGALLGRDGNAYQNSVHARLGNGAIVADGEGVERTLDLGGVWSLTNVLFVAESERTNGWDAVNKGEVVFPVVNDHHIFNNGDAFTLYGVTNCIGCSVTLEKPDLVNAVRVKVRKGEWLGVSYYTAAKFQAADRSDVHADALPDGFLPLGFWRAGTFDDRRALTVANRWNFVASNGNGWAEIEFRYDHRKVKKPESRLAVLRWDGDANKWITVARYAEQPNDFIVSSGRLTSNSTGDDEAWSLGLFCVAEVPRAEGTLMLIRGGGDSPGSSGEPLLRFGVVSDPHIGFNSKAPGFLESALVWLSTQRVDAVVCPGDMAHSGLISEMEAFANVWFRAFPDGRRSDGEKVELMLVTGNHDIDAWGGRWNSFTDEELAAKRFYYGDNPEKTWRRLFGQEWESVWRRDVKGFTFLGAQWRTVEPPIEEFVAEVAPTLDPDKPFFYIQHAHPAGTCHGAYSDGDDRGEARRALLPFPNAVAFSGHSHCTISDERGVWQWKFTSVGAGCTHSPRLFVERPEYVNGAESWDASYRTRLMLPVSNDIDGQDVGGCFEYVEVFADRIVVHRRSVVLDEPIGPAWVVPIPAREDGPLDFSRRAAAGTPPQFPTNAAVEVEWHPNGHALEGPGHPGEACVAVTFPYAENVGGHRVFDYEIRVDAEGEETVVRRILAPGFAFPERFANLPGTCLFLPTELPTGKPVRFTIVPRDCFGGEGRAIQSGEFSLLQME